MFTLVLNGCLSGHPECRYGKGKEEGREKGCFAPEHQIFKFDAGNFHSAISTQVFQ